MSLAHLHMTYAAAASNPSNGRLIFNNNVSGVPSFHASTSPNSLVNHHHHLMQNSVNAAAAAAALSANIQYQNHHSNYFNYQHHYNQQQQQQQQPQSTSPNQLQHPQFLPVHQRSTFAIQEILGLGNSNSNSTNQTNLNYHQAVAAAAESLFNNKVNPELSYQHHQSFISPASSTSSSSSSTSSNSSTNNQTTPSNIQFENSYGLDKKTGGNLNLPVEILKDTESNLESSHSIINRANEAAVAAAAAYGAYFGRGGFMPSFNSTSSNDLINNSAKLNNKQTEAISDLSDAENTNDLDEDSAGK